MWLNKRRRPTSAPHRAKLLGRRVCLGLFQVTRVKLRFNHFWGIAELLQDDAEELVYGTFSLLEVVVHELVLAPGFFHPSLDLIPLAFGLILIHMILLTSLRVGCPQLTFDDDLDAAVIGAPLG
jgi:hypothetical protein